MRKTLLAAALAATAIAALPILTRAADNAGNPQAQTEQMGEHWGDEHGGMGSWRHGPDMQGGRMMMMHRMMMGENPQERCIERLAWRAARLAYVETKLDLTPEQRPLWDKVESAAEAEQQNERQLCNSVKSGTAPTALERMDRMQQFLTVRLDGLQAAKPPVQALYQSLTPEQRAIFDRPFRRPQER